MEVPSFDLGFTLTQPEKTTGACTPDTRVATNLVKDFDMVANPDVVLDTPVRQQQASPIGKYVPCTLSKFFKTITDIKTYFLSFSVYEDPTPNFMSPHSALREVSGVKIDLRDEVVRVKYHPKSRRRIIGEPSDLLVDNPKRVTKPSRIVKSPFNTKQHTIFRHDSRH